MKPILALDVDGVVHALVSDCHGCTRKRVRLDERPRYRNGRLGPREREVLIPPGMRERVLRLAEAFHVVWCTAWRNSAPRACADLLDVPPWPCVHYRTDKAPALVRYAAGRPFAWCDDYVREELARLENPAYVDTPWPENAFALPVNPRTGLTDNDAERLLRFAEGVSHGSDHSRPASRD